MNKPATMRLMLMFIILLPTAAMIGGCFAGTHGSVISPTQRSTIVRGATTKQQLLRELGKPDQTIDLGGGKEVLSYIQETVINYSSYGLLGNSTKSEFWIVLKNNVVEAYGDRSTNKSPSYMKWLY